MSQSRVSRRLAAQALKQGPDGQEARRRARAAEEHPHQDSERDGHAVCTARGDLPKPSSRSGKDGPKSAVGCGFGSARRLEWTGAANGPAVGQVAGVGPVHVAEPSGGFASGRPTAAKRTGRSMGAELVKFPGPAWAALVPARSGRQSVARAMSRLGQGRGRRARQPVPSAQAALGPVSTA